MAQQTGLVQLAGCGMADNAIPVESLEARMLLTGTVEFTMATYDISEGAGNSTVVTLTRSGDTSGTASVEVALTDGSAIGGGQDYNLSLITVNFAALETTKTVTIPIINDRLVEGNETFFATLQNPDVGTTIGAVDTSTITILDNDFAVVDAQVDQAVSEGVGTATVSVTVTIIATGGGTIGLANGFTVDLNDALSGSAIPGNDYTFTSPDTITVSPFSAMLSTFSTNVPITDDRLVEANETIDFTISNLSTTLNGKVSLGDTTHQLTITDNDSASVAITTPGTTTVTEGGGVQLVNVTLTIISAGTTPMASEALAVSVSANLPGNADYSATAAVFNAGAMSGATSDISVSAIDDQLVEAITESFGAQALQVSSTAAMVSASTSQGIDVTDNDSATVTIAAGTTPTTEGGSGVTLPVTLTLTTSGSGPAELAVPVSANLPGNADYTPTAAVFGIGAVHGATANIVVTAVDDLNVEGTEMFSGQMLGFTSTASVTAVGSRTITIADNDSALITFTSPTSNPSEAAGTHEVQVRLVITSVGSTGTSQLDYPVSIDVRDATGGTATGTGTDYTATSTTVTFAAGSMTGNMPTSGLLTLVDDQRVETNETINLDFINLMDGTGGAVTIGAANTHVVTIADNDTATVAITSASPVIITEGGGSQNVVVTLTITSVGGVGPEQLDVPITVNLSTTDPDYTPTSATFIVGSVSTDTVNVGVIAIDDRRVEGTETKSNQNLTINSTAGVPVVQTGAGVDIQIDDNDTATIGFQSTATQTVLESVGVVNVTAVLTLTASGSGTIGLDYNASVPVTTTDGTAMAGTSLDYVSGSLAQRTITFVAGDYASGSGTASTSQLLTVNDDQRVEADIENLSLGFGVITFGGTGAFVTIDGAANSKTIQIDDNDFATVTVAGGTTTVAEGAAGVNLPVTLTLNTTGSVGAVELDVDVTADLLASTTSDYTSVSTTFLAGTASGTVQNIVVTAVNDNYVEQATETFPGQVLVVTSVSTDSVAAGTRTIDVIDDDTATLTIPGTAINVTEATPDVPVTVTVTLTINASMGGSGPIELASGVTLTATLPGNTDYTATTATFTGGAGIGTGSTANFDVTAVDDLLIEQQIQTFANQALSVASPEGAVVNATGSGTPDVNVTDNDSATVSIVGGTTTITEGNTANVAVTLTLTANGVVGNAGASLEVPVTANLPSNPDFTQSGTTFVATTGNGASQNILLTAVDDLLVEQTVEQFNSQLLSQVSTAFASATGSQNIHIQDNDSASISITGGPALDLAEAGGTQNLTVTLTLTTFGSGGTPQLATGVSVIGDLDVSGTLDVVVNMTADFLPGSLDGATQSIVVQAVDDRRVEDQIEAVPALNLIVSSIATTSASGSQAFNVTDNDSTSLSIVGGTTTVAEATPAVVQNVQVTIHLDTTGSGLESLDVDVSANLPGNADYAAAAALFQGGTGVMDGSTANIVVTAIDDRRVEGQETFAGEALFATTTAFSSVSGSETIVVTDNDTATISFQFPTSTATEGTTPHNVTGLLTISATGTGIEQLDQAVSVVVTDAGGGTAQGAGTDYTAAAGAPATITFIIGSMNNDTASTSALLAIVDDTLIEANETINLELLPANLTDGTGGQVTIDSTNDTHQVTLNDNDSASVSITSGTTFVTEDGATQNVVVTLALSANGSPGTGTLTVDITADLPGNADYSTTAAMFSGAAMLSNGATANIVITAINDTLIEASTETFAGELLSATSTATNFSFSGDRDIAVVDNDTAQVTIVGGTTTVTEGAASGANLLVTLNLTANGMAGTGTLTVDVTADLPGNADYITTAAQFLGASSLTDGATANIVVSAFNDRLVEGTEAYAGEALSFNSTATPTSGSGATGTETIEILDNDAATIRFQSTSSTVGEAGVTHNVSVTLTILPDVTGSAGSGPAQLAQAVSVDVSDAGGGTATNGGTDYTLTTATVMFASGSGSGTQATTSLLSIVDDRSVEGDETINLEFTNLTVGGTMTDVTIASAPDDAHQVTITDNDSVTVQFNAATSGTTETGAPTVNVPVGLTFTTIGTTGSDVLERVVTVDVTRTGGTATDGTDHSMIGTQTLTFGIGSTAATTNDATFTVDDDLLVEGDETVVLGVALNADGTNGRASIGAPSTHTVTIADNDTATISFAVASSNISEANTPHTVITTLTITANGMVDVGQLGYDVSFDVVDAGGGTATAGQDYSLTPQNFTFAAGSTSGDHPTAANLGILEDLEDDDAETINVGLSNLVFGGGPGSPVTFAAPTTHVVTIDDNDSPDSAIFTMSNGQSNVRVVLGAGGIVEIRDGGGTLLASRSLASMPNGLIINGVDDQDDTLTVDYSGGSPIPTAGLFFNGGENGIFDRDNLRVIGYALNTADGIADVTVNHTGPEAGNIVFAGLGTIFFTQLEPIALLGTAADLVINLPAGGNPDVVLEDDGGVADPDATNDAGFSSIDGSTFEYTQFANPTNSLRVNLGPDGDTITVNAMDGTFAPALGTTINGGAGADTIVIASPFMAILLGNAGMDTFQIDATLTGAIDGGAGVDTLQGTQINAVTLTGADSDGFNGSEASITGDFDGIDLINGTGVGSTLTGIFSANSLWTLRGGATGTYATVGSPAFVLNYTTFDSLVGGGNADDTFDMTANSAFNLDGANGDDTFNLDFILTGNIIGGLGTDLLQGTLVSNVTLTGSNAANGFSGTEADINGGAPNGFTGINTIIANNLATDTLTGRDLIGIATWNLDGAPDYNDGTAMLNFSGFRILNGGTGTDRFFVTDDTIATLNGLGGDDLFQLDSGMLTGSVNGGTQGVNGDTLQGNEIDDVVLTFPSDANGFNGTENNLSLGFTGMDRIIGNGLAGSTLQGEDFDSIWTLDGAAPTYDDGSRLLPIEGFRNLQGGSSGDQFDITGASDFDNVRGGAGVDTFNVAAAGFLTGAIDGEGDGDILSGTGIDNVTLTGSTATGEFQGMEANITGGFAGIGTIIGNGGTLIGQSAATSATSTWTLNGTPTYTNTSGHVLSFSGFNTLQGQNGVDNFTVSVASPFSLRGGAGADTFTLNAALTAGNSIDGEAGNDTLQGTTINQVTLIAANSSGFSGNEGDVPGGFAGIDTLIGVNSGSLTGFSVSGGTSATWTLAGGTGSYTDLASGAVLNLDNSVASVVTPGFTTLQGGTGIDTFNVNGNTTIELFGNGDADVFNLTGVLTGNITGGAGVDVVNFLDNGAVVTGNIDGGANGAIISFNATTTGVDVTISGAGGTIGVNGGVSVGFIGGSFSNITSIVGEAGGGNLFNGATGGAFTFGATATYTTGGGTVTFSQFEEAHGGANGDIFNVTVATTVALYGEGGDDTFNVSAASGNIFGGGGDDTLAVDFTNGAFDVTFDGEGQATAAGDNLIVAGNTFISITYNVTGVGAGNIVFTGATTGNPNGTITFTGIEPATITSSLGTVTINVDPTNAFPGTTITTTVSSAGGVTTVTFSSGAESLVFANPTVALIINGDNNGDDDIITVSSVDALFTSALTIVDGSGTDIININSSLALGSATSAGNLTLTAETINLNAATINTGAAATAGNVTLTATTINIDADLTIDTNSTTDGTLNIGGSVIDAVTGTPHSLTLDLGTTSFNDNANGHDYSTVSILSAADVTLSDNNAINMGNVNLTGTLSITSTGAVDFVGTGASSVGTLNIGTTASGAITDTGTGTLSVTGTATLNAGVASNITLNNANNFGTVVVTSGLDVTLNDTGAINIGTSDVSGSLTITAGGLVAFIGGGATIVGTDLNITTTAGGITDSGIGSLTVTGTATLAAGAANNITIDNTGNDFNTVAVTNGNNVALRDTNAINLGTSTISGTLTINAGGTISDSGPISVALASTFATTAGNILLDEANTFTGTVQVDLPVTSNLTLRDTTTLALDALIGGTLRVNNLTVTAVGITQTDILQVDGTTTLDGGAGVITLTNASNDFVGPVHAQNTGAFAIQLTDLNSIDLGNISTSNNLTVIAGGAGSITDSGTISVDGVSTLTANGGSILLDSANTFTGAVQVSLATSGDLTLRDTTPLALENQTAGVQTVTVNNLTVTAVGITQIDNFVVNGTTTLDGGVGAITLTNAGNNFVGPVHAQNLGANAIQLTDSNAIVLGNISTQNNLTVTAVGITQFSGTTLDVDGSSTFNGGAAAITLSNPGNDFTGAVNANNTGANAIQLSDTNAIVLGTVSTQNHLTVNAVGISQDTTGLTVTGLSSFNAGAGGVDLSLSASNNFTGAVSADADLAIVLRDQNSIDLGTVNADASLTVIANGVGTITDSGVITVGTTSQFTAGGNIILDSANSFAGTVQVSLPTSATLTLVDTNGGLALDSLPPGPLQVATLNVTTTAGDITQTDALSVTGTATLNSGVSNITLTTTTNDFGGTVVITGAANVSLDDASTLTMGAVTMTGTLNLDTAGAVAFNGAAMIGTNLGVNTLANGGTGGAITDGVGGSLTVTGASTLNAGTASVTLDSITNNFGGAVTISAANNVTLVDQNSLNIGGITATGTVTATARGNDNTLTVSGAISATGGATTFHADKMAIGAALTATGQTVTLLPFNADAINLGSAVDTTPDTLELSPPEVLNITAANLAVGNALSGPISISAGVTAVAGTNVLLTTATNNSITFGAAGSLTTTGNVTLTTDASGVGGIVSGGAASDVVANLLTITAGNAGIGGSGNPLAFNATTVVTTTGGNGAQFLSEADSVTWNTSTATASNPITLLGGQFNVGTGQTITASVLTVTTPAVLGGNGQINANVTGTGTVSPGTSPGILTINGNYSPTGTTQFELNSPYATAGTDYDRLLVNGTVTLNSSTLSLVGGAVAPAPGTVIPILLNDGVDAITGTFNGLADGAMVSVGMFTGYISYFGGDGNDITLTVASAGSTVINGTAGNDSFEIRRVGDTIQVLLGGVIVDSRPMASVSSYTINGGDGNDSLNVNFAASGGVFSVPVTFNGNGNGVVPPGDDLLVTGGTFTSLEYDVTGVGAGSLLFLGTTNATIHFTGIEPATVTSVAGTVTIDIDNDVDAFAGPITTTISDAAGGNMNVSFSVGAESLTFVTPTVALNILGDNDGDDTIIVTSVDADAPFRAALTIDGQGGTDTINLATSLLLGSTTSTGNLALAAETINLGSGASAITIATDGDVTNGDAGTVSLTATTIINIDQNVTIDTNAATTDGTLTVTGAIDAVTAGARTLTLDLGTTSVLLNNVGNNFIGAPSGTPGVVVLSADDVTLRDVDGINIGNATIGGFLDITAGGLVDFVNSANISIGDTLTVTTTAGGISDSGTGSLLVTSGDTTLNATGAGNNITLNGASNDFSTVAVTNGGNVTLFDVNGIDLGASTISGTLAVTTNGNAVTGTITQSGALAVASGVTTLTAGASGTPSNITLNGFANDFLTVSVVRANNVTLLDANAINLGNSTVSNNLSVTTIAGAISDNGNISVTGNANFTAGGAGPITLGDAVGETTNFGTLTFNSTGAVSISENGTGDGVDLTGTNTADSLVLIAETGTIEDAASTSLTVTNNASFTSNGAGSGITLGDNGGDSTNFGTLTFSSTGAVSISEDGTTNGVDLTGANTALSLVLIAETGTIEDAASTSLSVTNNASFTSNGTGSGITLGDNGGDSTNFGTLTFNSTGAVSISEDGTANGVDLTGINTADSLALTAETGTIEDAATTSLTVTNNASFTSNGAGSGITLGDNVGDTTNFGTLTFNSTGAVSISENGTGDGVDLTGVNTALSLVLIAEAGTIEDAAVTSLTVTNNAHFTSNGVGSGITLGDNGGDVTNFGTLTFSSAGAVLISEDGTTNGVDLTGTNTADSLVLTAETGTIEDATTTSLTVTNNATFTSNGAGAGITLGDQAADTTNFGSLTFSSAGNVTISEDSAMTVTGAGNTAAALSLTVQPNDGLFTLAGGAAIGTTTGATITADKMNLIGALNSAGQTVNLRTSVGADAINLGSAIDATANTLELSDAELDQITALTLNVGSATAGPVTISSPIDLTGDVTDLNVTNNGNISFFNLGSLTVPGVVTLISNSAAATVLSGNAVTDVIATTLNVTSGSGGIGISANPLTMNVTNLTASTGATNGNMFLSELNTVTVNGLTAGTGTITLVGGEFDLGADEVISNNSDVTVNAPAILDLNGFDETIDALGGNGNVTGLAAAVFTIGFNNGGATHSGVISGAMSLTKTGSGTQTLSGNNTYTGLTNVGISGVGGTLVLTGTNTGTGDTSVAAGTLLVNGSTTSNTGVSGTGTLGGTGVINGTVTLAAGSTSTLAPGSPITSTADIATGSLTIDSGTTFSVQVNGSTPNTQHDQVIVTGTVIHGNSTLQTSGTITSSPGQQIVLIANDGLEAVTGQFLGLAEGATVTINGVNFLLSYQGGAGGNDVTLTQAGPVTYSGAGALELRLNAGSVQFVDDGVVVDSRPLASVLNQTITVNGTSATDILTVNYAFGGFFDVDVAWNGGEIGGDNDELVVTGGTFTTVTHTFTTTGPANSGNIVYNTGAATATITYTGLEPVAMNSTVTDLTFNLPTGTNVATLDDDGGANDGISQLTSGGTFEATTFTHPIGTLTINGNTGTDTFTINGLDGMNQPAAIVINGGAGNDVLNGPVIDAVVLSTASAPNANGFTGSENSFAMSFSGINTITGSGGTLAGRDAASTWNLDGTPTYENGTNVLNFTGFATLIGGSNDDTFNVSANASPFNLNGGDGTDVFSFTNTGNITGAVDGGAGTNDTIVGDNDGNLFDVTGADSGTLAGKTTGWSNVENLTGGTGSDTFTVQAAGSLTGAISALSSTDTLDLSAVAGASATVAALSNTGASLTAVTNVGGGATGIDNLIGSGTGTLTGENATRTWNLGATQTYANGPNTLTFSGFATLQGGSGADTFNVTVDPASVAQINGGAGADLFDVDVALTAAINGEAGSDTLQGTVVNLVTLTGSDANGFGGTEADINGGVGSFDGIDVLIGSGGTLTGRDVASTWNLDGTPTYSDGTATLSIAGFAVLQGGLDVDTFNVTAASTFDLLGGAGFDVFNIDATLTGLIDGQTGLDTLQGSRINLVVLTGSDGDGFGGTEADITGNFDGIDTINGTLTGTLTGEDVASLWELDGSPTYDDGANTLNFSGFRFLQGGIDVDTFELTADSAYMLNGGEGDDVFTMDAVLSGAVIGGADFDLLQGSAIEDVRLFDSTDDGFAGFAFPLNASFFTIDSIIGNGTGRLTGQDVNSFWELDAAPTYTNAAGHVLEINGFAVLQGGSAVDTFEISAPSDFDIFGGDGNDFVTFLAGGSLTGTANGEAGVDRLNASLADAAVVMTGGDGNDFLIGSAFDDNLSGDNGNDLINGGDGDDTLSGGLSNDTINGGAGTDRLTEVASTYLTLTNTTLMGLGNDKLSSIESAELFGNDNNNTLDASKFTAGRVTLRGGAGNDTLIGTNYDADTNADGFHDELDGGDGIDTVKQSSTTDQSITVGPDPDSFVATGAGTDLWRSIEKAYLSISGKAATTLDGSDFTGSLTLLGGGGNDVLIGGSGSNYLNGNSGNDELIGGGSLDTLLGGAGNDTLEGGDSNDVLKGGADNDRILGGQGEDVLFGEAGNDKIFGGDGDDFLDGGAGNDTLTGESGDDLINGGVGNDAINGGSGDDTITGNAGNDTILGGSGDDVLKGGGGSDKISGESGNDRIEATKSTVATGSGNDTIVGSGNKIDEVFSFNFDKLLL